jgi:hypothetical protein
VVETQEAQHVALILHGVPTRLSKSASRMGFLQNVGTSLDYMPLKHSRPAFRMP